jgi:ATP-dependent Clp protease adaptor protein ClpS
MPSATPDIRFVPETDSVSDPDRPGIVILYNDDWHGMSEVVLQLQKATGASYEKAVHIMLEAHTNGRAVAYAGTMEECERVAAILRQIRLQVETDRA